ncbi:MAG TPA: c-type cytochrome [Conexibacter sp.]|nr:c-type cytochrome [Conexibacter sp.]
MLATAAFLAFWVVVGLVLFFIALRGGPRGARATLQSQSRGSRRTAAVVFAAFYVAIGVAVPVLILVGNHDSAAARVNGTTIELTQREQDGRVVFGEYCASCHMLAAAGADGKVGPNLDQLQPPAGLVEDAVERGRQRGNGTMPAGIVQGEDVAAVAAFVAAVGGR